MISHTFCGVEKLNYKSSSRQSFYFRRCQSFCLSAHSRGPKPRGHDRKSMNAITNSYDVISTSLMFFYSIWRFRKPWAKKETKSYFAPEESDLKNLYPLFFLDNAKYESPTKGKLSAACFSERNIHKEKSDHLRIHTFNF